MKLLDSQPRSFLKPVVVLIAVALILAYLAGLWRDDPSMSGGVAPDESVEVGMLEAYRLDELRHDGGTWRREVAARDFGSTIDVFWDALNASADDRAIFVELGFERMLTGAHWESEVASHGVVKRTQAGGIKTRSREEFAGLVSGFAAAGWTLVQSEFRHNAFVLDATEVNARSIVTVTLHVENVRTSERAIVHGDVQLHWVPWMRKDLPPTIRQIDISRLAVSHRVGSPMFEKVLDADVAPPDRSHFNDPLIVSDLDADGDDDLLMVAANTVFWNKGGMSFERGELCRYPPDLIFTALLADFDQDGIDDLLCVDRPGLILYIGEGEGRFDRIPRRVWRIEEVIPGGRIEYGQALTAGDIDRDGDLDVWLGQYKTPYTEGQMPTPIYDANDGHPSFLLLNDGAGNFSNTSEKARSIVSHRRTYSASFVDLDSDTDLDLLVVSDFAGADVWLNDGTGKFAPAPTDFSDHRLGLGMAHLVQDLTGDGEEDIFMIGMGSPTVSRLDHLKIGRQDFEEYTRMRSPLTYGNRLLGRTNNVYRQVEFAEPLDWSGWSWGVTDFDLGNDGTRDVYIANGHTTGQTVEDYDPQFWCHDIYHATSEHDEALAAFFGAKTGALLGDAGLSYGGNELNRLVMRNGDRWLETGFLAGVAMREDSRAVASSDLDGDGRVDLIVTTFEQLAGKHRIVVFANRLTDPGNHIVVSLGDSIPASKRIGARVEIETSSGVQTRNLIIGESYRTQHPSTAHFGIGPAERVDRITVFNAIGERAEKSGIAAGSRVVFEQGDF